MKPPSLTFLAVVTCGLAAVTWGGAILPPAVGSSICTTNNPVVTASDPLGCALRGKLPSAYEPESPFFRIMLRVAPTAETATSNALGLLHTITFAQGHNASQPSGHARDEEVIGRLNEQWLKAFDIGNMSILDRIESDDFTVSGDFGQVTKQQQLDGVRQRSEKAKAITRRIDNQRFRFYGDVALVTETDHASSADGTYEFQTTTLWVRRGDGWKVVHLHYSGVVRKL